MSIGKGQHILALAAVASLLLLNAAPSSAIMNGVVESFTTTTYKDVVNTTADWNTSTGRLQFLPFQATLLGNLDTGLAQDVVVSGRVAYVTDEVFGVKLVDVSNPAGPFALGSYDTPGTARGEAIAGTTLFVADDVAGLQILNVSNTSSPSLNSTYNTPGTAMDVAVSGNVAYVADGSTGLLCIDVTNPNIPILLGSYDTPDFALGVEVRGTTAYVADGNSGLQILNVSNPASPTLLGSYNTPGSAYGLDVAGKYAYVADRASGLQVLNVQNPASPTLVGNYDTPGDAWGVVVSGTEAFIGDLSAGLQVVNVLNPASPTLITSYDTSGNAAGVAVAGTVAYVADGSPGLELVSMRSTTPLSEVGAVDTPDFARRIAVAGTIAYVADDDASGLQLIDLSNPASPVALGSYNTPGIAFDVFISGNTAYVADGPAGLVILDVTTPGSPAFLGSFDTPGTASGVWVSGTTAYVADGNSGILAVNVSNPAFPSFITSQSVPGFSSAVAVSGKTVFVTHPPQGLRTFNINTNGNLQFLGNVSTPGTANSVAVSGTTAYVADGPAGLQVINVTNLTTPNLLGAYDTPGDALGVVISGKYAFVADGASGLQVLDVSSFGSPIFVASYDTPGSSQGLAIAGSRALVADADFGLRAIQVFQNSLDLTRNVGQSLALDGTTDNIFFARLTASAVNTSWLLTANGGTNWQAATSGSGWVALTPGSDLRWKATIASSPATANLAGASDATLEWLYTFAGITSIRDVGNDQGRQVRLQWLRSANDFVGASPQIIEYAVYRKIEAGFQPSLPPLSVNTEWSEAQAPLSTTAGAHPLLPTDAELLEAQAAGWDYVTTVPADAVDDYSVVVPTMVDSTIASGQHTSTFRVRARTATPGVFFDSYPDSGYSIDNLAPTAPMALVVAYHSAGANQLDWSDPTSADFDYFRVYRSTDPNFLPAPANLASTTTGSAWADPDFDMPGVYYKVSAVDYSGNESSAVSASTTVGIDPGPGLERFAFHLAGPNPFRGSTLLRYDVPASGGNVRIHVYGIDGRLVRTLVDGPQTPGSTSIAWDGRDRTGQVLPAGTYFLRMEASGFAAVRKLLLLR